MQQVAFSCEVDEMLEYIANEQTITLYVCMHVDTFRYLFDPAQVLGFMQESAGEGRVTRSRYHQMLL